MKYVETISNQHTESNHRNDCKDPCENFIIIVQLSQLLLAFPRTLYLQSKVYVFNWNFEIFWLLLYVYKILTNNCCPIYHFDHWIDFAHPLTNIHKLIFHNRPSARATNHIRNTISNFSVIVTHTTITTLSPNFINNAVDLLVVLSRGHFVVYFHIDETSLLHEPNSITLYGSKNE